MESLHRFVDPESLPSYLGGDLPPDGDCTVDTSLIKDILKEDEFFKGTYVVQLYLLAF